MTSETKQVALAGQGPTNPLVRATLTDLYQITMLYAYWLMGRHNMPAVFDLFHRTNPFGGEFSVFGGLDEVIKFVRNYRITEEEIAHLRTMLPYADPAFFDWLRELDCSEVKLYALMPRVAFPRVPLIKVCGPIGICQLLETMLLNLVNYPSLIATNAVRMRLAAGKDKTLLEFGLRRAQGPDGGISASKYSYWGGFDGTSNVLAASLFNLPCSGTHAHSWVLSFGGFGDIPKHRRLLMHKRFEQSMDFVDCVVKWRKEFGYERTHEGELAAFTAYALAFPEKFLALVDTYNTLGSGVPNYLCVAAALYEFGYQPLGIRLDSGDLAFLSKGARKMFFAANGKTGYNFHRNKIAASNDIDEAVLYSLKEQGHEIDVFGIGTNLVTCEAQPAFGGVYKLVKSGDRMPMKLSEQTEKNTIPGDKEAYRLYNSEGKAVCDLMVLAGESAPAVGQRVLCRHPFQETKRMYVTPSKVSPLHRLVWDGRAAMMLSPADAIRDMILDEVYGFRADHTRAVNPTPYKVSVSQKLYELIHTKLAEESPIPEVV